MLGASPLTGSGSRKGRIRWFTNEQIQKGFGLLRIEPLDFPRERRIALAASIVQAHTDGLLTEWEDVCLAVRVHSALSAPAPLMEALRWHLGADGHELFYAVRRSADLVPALVEMERWVCLPN